MTALSALPPDVGVDPPAFLGRGYHRAKLVIGQDQVGDLASGTAAADFVENRWFPDTINSAGPARDGAAGSRTPGRVACRRAHAGCVAPLRWVFR
jgi:hypothetical protein